ncbi:hypothetical protein Bca4012_020569 [Brassica carinata]|uniref:Uncharacterized protein n=1 Tax=Brassica carinata TaxID=52824 RepID=A0A8X8BD06_BRACI|nr:hypothetical protein Bca52824_001083 [Brassica carinata]
MIRCFVLPDIYSQPQQSSCQRRQQILTEGTEEDDFHDFSDIDGDDIPQHNVHETHGNKEIYHFNVNAIQLGFLLEEVRNVQDVGVVHKDLEDVVIEEDNRLRLQYKTQLMNIKNFSYYVYNSYAHYFIDIAESNDEDKYPHSGGLSSGSPSSVANIGFTNYFESGSTSHRPRRGDLFNIWGNSEEPNEGHQSDSGDED